mgnify:CR=1 FL=1
MICVFWDPWLKLLKLGVLIFIAIFQGQESKETNISPTESDEKQKQKEEEEEKQKRPLLLKSSLLRILAEVVKSYSNCAGLITQHTYLAEQSELIAEVGKEYNITVISKGEYVYVSPGRNLFK